MGRNRLTASVSAAVLAAGASLLGLAPPAAAATVHKVHLNDYGPGRPWLRLQDDPANIGQAPGVQRISPFADPQHPHAGPTASSPERAAR